MKRLLPVLLATALLVGCAGMPVRGPIVQVTSLPAEPRAADIAPAPPLPGVSPEQLVAGFLVAMAAAQPGLGVARQYLTNMADAQWHPENESVQIYEAAIEPPGLVDGNVVVDASMVGEIDKAGHFSPRAGRLRHDFGLVKEGDQWRISNPPKGLLLSRYMFGRYFKPYPVYFFNSRQQLVPELVHLPNAQATPERVLTMLLRGPSAALAEAVTTAFPRSAQLLDVTIDDDGTAEVDLSGVLSSLNDEQRRQLGAQLSWTLTSFPRITGVAVLNGGASYAIPGQSDRGILDLASQQGYQVLSGSQASGLFAVKDGRIGLLSDRGDFEALSGPLGAEGADTGRVAFSLDGSLVAAVDASGQRLYFGPTESIAQPTNLGLVDLRDPQVVSGKAWVLGRTATDQQAVARVDGSGKVTLAVLDHLPGRVVALQLAPAGARAAVVIETAGGRSLGTVVVEEADDHVTLGNWQDLRPRVGGVALTGFLAVAWVGETDLVTLARANGPRALAYTVTMDGSTATQLGPVGDHELVDVSAQPRKSGLTLATLTADGHALRFDARARWQQIPGGGLTQVAYAG